MTDIRFETEQIEDPEVVSELSMDDYEKYRLKTGELTLDLAIVGLEDRDGDEYIKQRKNEIADSDTEVPHPYKPEKQSREKEGELVEFSGKEGKGFADPEFKLVAEGDSMARYSYRVFWIEFLEKEKLCEVEAYVPKGSEVDVESISRSIQLG